MQIIQRPAQPDGQPGATRLQLEGASVSLIQAAGLFKRLTLLPKAQLQSRGLRKEDITKHVSFCEKLSQTAVKLIDKVKAADEMRQVRFKSIPHQHCLMQSCSAHTASDHPSCILDLLEAVRSSRYPWAGCG
jgi:hypothetical protein